MLLWLSYSLIRDPRLALLLALSYGLWNGLYQVAGVIYVNRIAPPEHAGLAQGVFSGLVRGLGPVLGSLAGGAIFQAGGAPVLYRLCSLFALLALGCCLLAARWTKPRSALHPIFQSHS